MNRRLKAIRVQLRNDFTTVSTARVINVSNADYRIVHENPLDNPLYSKALNGFLSPYSVGARVRFSYTFDRVLGSQIEDVIDFFDDLTLWHRDNNYVRLNYNYDNGDATNTADFLDVVLEQPMEMIEAYKRQYGTFAPQISFISQDLITGAIPTALYGV